MFPSCIYRLISQYPIIRLNYKTLLLNKGTEEKEKDSSFQRTAFL